MGRTPCHQVQVLAQLLHGVGLVVEAPDELLHPVIEGVRVCGHDGGSPAEDPQGPGGLLQDPVHPYYIKECRVGLGRVHVKCGATAYIWQHCHYPVGWVGLGWVGFLLNTAERLA